MKDIIRILQDIASDLSISYSYGKKAALNLLDGSLDDDKMYLLHEFTNRKSEYNENGTKITALNYEGKFFLVAQSGYETSLKNSFKSIREYLIRQSISIIQFEYLDVTDALDTEMCGLLCSYKVQILN